MLQDILMHGYFQNFKGFRQKTRKIQRLQFQPIRAKCTCMRVRSCNFDHVILSMLLIYPYIMSFKAFHQKCKKLRLYQLNRSFHMLHVHALASTCAQNDLRSANLHNMSTDPKNISPQSDVYFTRSFPDKKVPRKKKKKKNNQKRNSLRATRGLPSDSEKKK